MKGLPQWLRQYHQAWLAGDITAGLIVTVIMIPQGLAYAMLAGLPPETGLYGSILPIIIYGLTGSSMAMSVGPAAILSLMVTSALSPLAVSGSAYYLELAIQLSLISGIMLVLFGLFRLGFLAYFLSHTVISGFITGSAVIITFGQLDQLLGVNIFGHDLSYALDVLGQAPLATICIGIGSLVALWLIKSYLPALLVLCGLSKKVSNLISKLGPVLVVIVATVVVAIFDLDKQAGVRIVGDVPEGLPPLNFVLPNMSTFGVLWLPALLIALIGFVESVSIAQSFAIKNQQRIYPDREFIGLGLANMASAFSSSFPVAGSFSRSGVNLSAGANTPLAGMIAAVLMLLIISSVTGWFYYMPYAVLSATIIMSVIALVDLETFKTAWDYDRADAFAWLATAIGVIFIGVEGGIFVGVALSLAVMVWRSSRPHMAVVGRMGNSEHFRNVKRHQVTTLPGLLALRVDESLFFANATVVEDKIQTLITHDPSIERVLLICSAMNSIDATALGVLTQLEDNLSSRHIEFILAEVKGPVMDRLRKTPLGARLEGRIFMSAHAAFLYAEQARSSKADLTKNV
jgi:SulP family sulfate permease